MNPLMAVVDAVIIVEMVRHNLICLRIYDPFQRPAVRPGVSDVDEHRILFPAAQVDKFLFVEFDKSEFEVEIWHQARNT